MKKRSRTSGTQIDRSVVLTLDFLAASALTRLKMSPYSNVSDYRWDCAFERACEKLYKAYGDDHRLPTDEEIDLELDNE